MDNQNEDEKRQFNRVFHSGPVQIQFKDPSLFGGCLSCDLSEGGVRVRINEFIPLKTELALTIRLADESIIECTGRVKWVEKTRFGDCYQAGLEFFSNDPLISHQEKIYKFLSHQ